MRAHGWNRLGIIGMKSAVIAFQVHIFVSSKSRVSGYRHEPGGSEPRCNVLTHPISVRDVDGIDV